MHNNKKQKILEICSKNKVTWQTNPLKLKILNFIGNGKSPETVGKLIEEIKQMVLYHEITFERYQVPLVLKEKKNLQKEFPIIIKMRKPKKSISNIETNCIRDRIILKMEN